MLATVSRRDAMHESAAVSLAIAALALPVLPATAATETYPIESTVPLGKKMLVHAHLSLALLRPHYW